LKYLLLGFFVWAIFSMTPTALHSFIESPYNKIADIKMMLFFVNIGKTGGIILIILALLSIFIQGFWCRYLCPYGALLGLFSWMSPVKVRRDPVSCTNCGLCDKVCPSRLPVMTKLSITSPECLGCGDCVSSCPVKNTLTLGVPERSFSAKRLAMLIILFFLIGYSAARVGGVWGSGLSDGEYRHHIQNMDSEDYGHPGR
jgi:polyferredoxin